MEEVKDQVQTAPKQPTEKEIQDARKEHKRQLLMFKEMTEFYDIQTAMNVAKTSLIESEMELLSTTKEYDDFIKEEEKAINKEKASKEFADKLSI